MKSIKKSFAMMMALVLIVVLFSGSAVATKKYSGRTVQNDDIQKMISGKWYKLNNSKTYSFTLSKDSLVTISWTISENDDMSDWTIFADKNSENRVVSFSIEEKRAMGLAMRKGTYYIKNDNGNSEGNSMGKMKINISKLPNDRKNYCPARAVSLKKNTKYTIARTPLNNYYYSWFKIKTSRIQNITINSSNVDGFGCDLIDYDIRKSYIFDEINSTTRRIEEKLPAGTYYLLISIPYRYGTYASSAVTFWWR